MSDIREYVLAWPASGWREPARARATLAGEGESMAWPDPMRVQCRRPAMPFALPMAAVARPRQT